MLIDSHCHLDEEHVPGGHAELLARARAVGVRGFATIGVGRDLGPARAAVAIAESRRDVVATVGVHPHDAAAADDAVFAELEALASRERVVAVGEIGLDYHYEHSPKETQQLVFRKYIDLAKRLKKPIIVHTRSAAEDTLAILREENARDCGGVIHCFSEDLAFATAALELGFYLSFSGIVTFKTAAAIQEVAKSAPADRILVETDAPYLAPVPLRGKRCEPAFVVHTAKKVAELRGVAIEDLEAQTTANALRFFGPALEPS